MPTQMTNQEKLIAYAATADLGELTSTIRTLSVIRDSRVNAASGASAAPAKKASAKKPTVDANGEAKPKTVSTEDGKDPERVERGLRAAATRAKNKAVKEAQKQAEAQERTVQGEQQAQDQAQAEAQQAQGQAVDDLDLENFQVPRANFGEEGELIRDATVGQ